MLSFSLFSKMHIFGGKRNQKRYASVSAHRVGLCYLNLNVFTFPLL